MKQRTDIYLLGGFGITVALFLLSTLASRSFAYRDLTMMPKPFSLYAPRPGIIAGEWFGDGWIGYLVLLLSSSTVYTLAVFSVSATIRAARS